MCIVVYLCFVFFLLSFVFSMKLFDVVYFWLGLSFFSILVVCLLCCFVLMVCVMKFFGECMNIDGVLLMFCSVLFVIVSGIFCLFVLIDMFMNIFGCYMWFGFGSMMCVGVVCVCLLSSEFMYVIGLFECDLNVVVIIVVL